MFRYTTVQMTFKRSRKIKALKLRQFTSLSVPNGDPVRSLKIWLKIESPDTKLQGIIGHLTEHMKERRATQH